MEAEDFRTLIEIQSLDNQEANHNKNIESENKRITDIEEKRSNEEIKLSQFKSDLNSCKKELALKETELFKIESNLEKTSKHATMVTSNDQAKAIEKELDDLGEKKGQLEEKILILFEKQEDLESSIKDSGEFLKGSLESLDEIKKEVANNIESENKQISSLQDRVSSLQSLVPNTLNDLFQASNKHYRFNNPIAFIDKGYCTQCHYATNITKEKDVDLMTSFESCEGCGRLFAPQAAKSANLRG